MAALAFCVGRFFPYCSTAVQLLLLLILGGLVGLGVVIMTRYWKRIKRVNEASRLARAFLSVASEVDEILIVDETMNLVCAKPWACKQGAQNAQSEGSVFSFDAIIRDSFVDQNGMIDACQKALQQGLYFEDVFEALKKNALDADCFVRIRVMPLFTTSSSHPSYRVITFSDVTLYQSRALLFGAEASRVPSSSNSSRPKEAAVAGASSLIALLEHSFDRASFGIAMMNGQGVLTSVNVTLSNWLGAASKRALVGRSFLGLTEGNLTLKDLLKGADDPTQGLPLRLRLNRLDPAFDVFAFLTAIDEDRSVLTFFKQPSERGKDFLDTLPFPSLLTDAKGIPQVLNMRLIALLQKRKVPVPKAEQPLTELLDETSQATWNGLFRSATSSIAAPSMPSSKFFELRFANADLSVMGALKRLDRDQFLVQLVDSSEQKKLEQQFFQAQKNQAIGQLAGGIAHDFNNLLTAIIGFCDLLLQRVMPNDPSFSDIMHIKQNANRASNLVKQLLAFSRRQTLQPRRIDVTDTLADLSVLLRRLLGAPVTLRLVRNRETWPIKVDVSQFEQVIINLAVNARDAMEKGGELTIETSNVTNSVPRNVGSDILCVGDYVLISVQDTGVGIPEDVLKVIFEPFFSTKPQGKGTGLGLATVYGIVHQTGGAIAVESKVGRGTTFKIFLPRCHDKEEPPAAPRLPVQDMTGNETILLVEDESTVRLFAARALRDKGYRVLEAANGKAALGLVTDGARPDIVLTDVSMPEMSGPILADKIREILPEVPVVFMSGYAAETFRKDLSENQSMHFLSKPFTLRDLATMVREILEERKSK